MTKLALLVMVVAAGCGDDGGKGNGAKDAAIDGKSIDASHADAAVDGMPLDGPPGTVQLTVKNYLSWCSVSVNGGTASATGVQNVFVTPGNINLVATRASATFEVSGKMWHHTMGDTGTGETGVVTGTGAATQSAAVAVVASTAKCVWVCCPFAGGTGCESTLPEQCP